MLDAASACLIDKDLIPQSHEGTLTLFSLHLIKPGLIDVRFSDWLKKIRKARLEADYRHVHVFSREEAHEACEAAPIRRPGARVASDPRALGMTLVRASR